MASFKVKLVGYFVILSLLPLAAAFWGFNSVARSSETSRVDARLQAGLRATLAAYQDELAAAGQTATALATNPSFQQALSGRNTLALHAMLRDSPDIQVVGTRGLRMGDLAPFGAQRAAVVEGPKGPLGRVVVSVRLDSAFLAYLQRRSGLDPDDRLALVSSGTEIAGDDPGAPIVAAPGATTTVSVDGTRFRVLVGSRLPNPSGAAFAVLSPQAAIDSATHALVRRLLLGLAGSLFVIALVAYFFGRSTVRTLGALVRAARALARGELGERVAVRGRDEFAELGRTFNEMAAQLESRVAELEAERVRLREATARLGDALAATHDVDVLLRVIVQTAVESTNAAAGWIVSDDGVSFAVGEPLAGGETIDLPLHAGRHLFGTLVLNGPAFSVEEAEAASSFASEAVIALENARLHQIVERQAASDALTGLANRRHCEDALHSELARVERFDASVAFVLADLDDFKAVNDRYGHPTGDAVLRAFADTLRANVREFDVAARWGGEEFAIVLPGADVEGAAQLADRIRAALADRVVLAPNGSPIPFTASFGVAAVPPESTDATLVAAADAALYEAKRTGKNRVVWARRPLATPPVMPQT